MARGWESKSVEEQISQAEKPSSTPKPQKTPEQIRAGQERNSLELTLAKIRSDLSRATNDRHREMLENALKELQSRIDSLIRKQG